MIERSAALPALVLAAGYGTRLSPITDHVPKPLLPVGGVPLLDTIIARLLGAGASAVAVNSHHLGAQVAAHLATHAGAGQLVHFPETGILGTGGALNNARGFLAAGPRFLVHNGDVVCDADLTALLAAHDRRGAVATLLLAPYPAVDTVTLGADGSVRHIGGTGTVPEPAPGDRRFTYTGIGVFDRGLLDDIGPGFSSLIEPLVRAMAARPGSVQGYAPTSLVWHDLGTVGRWLALAGPDTVTEAGFHLTRLTGHGSDRRFWRVGHGEWSAVAMVSPPGDDEYGRFLAVGRFLATAELGPARFLAVDEPERTVLMEDLGTANLHALVSTPSSRATAIADAYTAVVDHLLRLQAATDQALASCPLAVDRQLDLDQLRWETTYFRERFLQGHLELPDACLAGLDDEFTALAETVAEQPRVLLHRDFQSQNILLQAGAVRLVDYQGLRLGPLAYDLASLVWDPYVDIPVGLRQALVTRFAAGCAEQGSGAVADMTTAAALQRVMQALGAYGYLGRVKGKPGFLVHIPAAVRNLQALLTELAARRAGVPTAAPSVAKYLPPAMPCLTRLVADLGRPESAT